METDDLIQAEEFCSNHEISFSFIDSLQQYGLIEITTVEQSNYIPQSELGKLEQLTRLHYDLQINLEGIDAITHLLERVQRLQSELMIAKQRLSIYEDPSSNPVTDVYGF